MGLVELESVAPLLICPRCGCGLVEAERAYRCGAVSCVFSTPEAFPVVGRWPVLVDFERSILRPDAVLSLPDGRSVPLTGIPRWSIDRLPRPLRSWWKPVNRVAARNVELLLSLLPGSSPLILVVGGGTMGNGLEELYADERLRLLAFDVYPSPLTRFVADAHQIPLADESVDAVVIQAVLEHVLDPQQVVGEIHRVLRQGGLVYAETPFLQQVHAGPYDFTRYTRSGHRYLFRNFEEIVSGSVAGPGTQMLWSVDHLLRGLLRSELAGKLARGVLFGLRYLDRVIPDSYAMDDASAYYFLGERSDRALTPEEIIAYYRGAQRTRSGRRSAPH